MLHSFLTIYEEIMPHFENRGKVGYLLGNDEPTPLFWNGLNLLYKLLNLLPAFGNIVMKYLFGPGSCQIASDVFNEKRCLRGVFSQIVPRIGSVSN